VQPAPAQKDSPAAFDPAAVFAARPEAAPLKSAGLNWQSPDIPVDPAGVLRQVENGIVAGLKTGRTALHLRLSPEDLGGIDLRLSTGAGGASVTLTAETQATSALLEQRLGELRQALQDAGVQVHTLNVGREQLSQQRQAPERGQFEMPQPATSASKGQPQSETPTLRRATNSQVEYLV
jgi:flagellar hook-length control protein FliK